MLVYPQIYKMLKQMSTPCRTLVNLFREGNPKEIDGKLVFAPVAYLVRRKSHNLYICTNQETNITTVANCQVTAYYIFDDCASNLVKSKSHFVSPDPVDVIRLQGIPFVLCLN